MKFTAFLVLLCFVSTAFAADLVDLSPITHKILCLRFDDGHMDYYGLGESPYDDNVAYLSKLNTSAAVNASKYEITSTEDPNYATPQQPVALGRKTKGMDFYSPWDNPEYIQDHWIYMELPHALQPGKTYTVRLLDGLADNKKFVTFTYNVFSLRSDTVHVNQLGFPPHSPKFAYLSQWMGDFNHSPHLDGGLELDDLAGASFYVYNIDTFSIAYSGTIAKRKDKTQADSANSTLYAPNGNYTLADVWECDFSDLTTPGRYIVAVQNIGCSYPFEIKPDVYREAFHTAMRGLFFQRSGIVQEILPGLNYPRDHHPDDAHVTCYYDPNFKYWKNSNHNLPGFSYTRVVTNTWGYYHDAGDWDGYRLHLQVPNGLLVLYDLKSDSFVDGDVSNRYKFSSSDPAWVEEGSDGLPDLLNEARWLLEFHKRVRHGLVAQGYGTGGSCDYIGREACGGNGVGSWQDTRDWAVTAESPATTYRYAGMAAYYAIMLDDFYSQNHPGQRHPDSPAWETEALDAYAWAQTYINNNAGDDNADVREAKMTADAAMYRLTTNNSYQTAMKSAIEADGGKNNSVWVSVGNVHFAAWCYLLLNPADYGNLDTSYYNTLKNRYLGLAANPEGVNAGPVSPSGNGLRIPIDNYRHYMLGTFSIPRAFMSCIAFYLTGTSNYLDTVHHAAAYALGGNELNMSHLTMQGDNPERFAFHPDTWFLLDYDSKVYVNRPLPGYSVYSMDSTSWVSGIGDERWSHETCHPDFGTKWAKAEGRIFNRNSINGSEFTVSQCMMPMAFILGFLCDTPSGPYTPNAQPTVTLNLTDSQQVPAPSVLPLTVTASPDTARVRYYYEWHFIGESTDKDNDFLYNWAIDLAPGQSKLITAVAYDDKGLISEPSDGGDKTISLIATSAKPALMGVPTEGTNGYTISFGGLVEGLVYTVQQKANPAASAWTKVQELIATSSSTNIALPTPTPTGGVFRVVYNR